MKLSPTTTFYNKLSLFTLFFIVSTLIGCATEDNTNSSSSIFEGLASSGIDIVLDASGNPVVAGFGYGDVSTNSGSSEADVFLSRASSSDGSTLSFKQVGSSKEDFAQSAVVLGDNTYIAGFTSGGLTTDGALGGTDIFLMRFNSSGEWQWTKQYGTIKNDYCWDIATDGSALFLVGNTEGVFSSASTINNHGNDIFLLKLDATGDEIAVIQLGEDTAINSNLFSQSYGVSVAIDSSSDVVIGGITNDTLGSNNIGGNDIIIAKYADDLSTQKFLKQLGTAYNDSITDLVIDGTEIYFTGFSYGTPDASYDYSAAGYSEDHSYTELFVYNYDSSGDQDWVVQAGTEKYDRGYGIAYDSTGDIYVTGNTNGDLSGTNTGSYDYFILKYDTAGILQWKFQYGSDVYDTANGIAYDSVTERIFITGKTYGTLHSQSNSSSSFSTFVSRYDVSPDTHAWTVVY